MNPSTLNVKRGLFNLVETLCDGMGRVQWRDMGRLIRLKTTLRNDRYIILQLATSFYVQLHSDGFGQFHQDKATPL